MKNFFYTYYPWFATYVGAGMCFYAGEVIADFTRLGALMLICGALQIELGIYLLIGRASHEP